MTEGHGPEFHFEPDLNFYFFLKKNKEGHYSISTPTSGFAFVRDTVVAATYRHSYHKAYVPVEIYEKTMKAIFDNYHGKEYDKVFINQYVDKYLSMAPASFDQDKINTFFAQHVALETAYHLRLSGYYEKILPFLADTKNFHNQASGVRALISYNTEGSKSALVKVIDDSTRINLIRVMAVWTLSEFKPASLKDQLTKMAATAPEDSDGFGGDIMDPRICTEVPSVKSALETLIQQL